VAAFTPDTFTAHALASSPRFRRKIQRAKPPGGALMDSLRFRTADEFPAVVSLLIDFEAGSEKKFWRKLLDREADGLRSLRKTSVADRLSLRFPIAGGNSSASAP
jgi:hypothetical protein